jgi:NAD(P)-dependent dehydrogenase (short-subunit alcohol dehydrogenase family)
MGSGSVFENKTVLITGAASGLGRAVALELARQGAGLILSDRNQEQMDETLALVREFDSPALAVQADVTRPEDCRKMVEAGLARFQKLDYLVASAGVSMWAAFDEVEDLSIFGKIMDVNYLGVVYSTYFALPHLKQSKGLITAICSIQGRIGVPFHTGYAASKHALHGFFSSLRYELASSKVDVLVVYPHWIQGTGLRSSAFGKNGQTLGPSKRRHTSEAVSPEQCSQAIARSMARRERELLIPSKLRALLILDVFSPRLAQTIVNRRVKEQKT